MKQKATKRLFAVLLVMLMALSILPTLALNANESPFDTAKDGGRVGDLSKQDTLTPDPTEIVDIMVEVKDNEPLMEVFKLDDIRAKKSTVNTYENRMLTRQDSAKGKIEALVEEKVRRFTITPCSLTVSPLRVSMDGLRKSTALYPAFTRSRPRHTMLPSP